MLASLSSLKKKFIGFTLIVIATTAIASVLLMSAGLQDLENRSWDWRLRALAEKTEADPRIKLIMIDQASIEHFDREERIYWPWPRELYVPILEFLKQANAKAAAFDILFTEQSHYSVQDDEAFAASVKGTLPVVAAIALRQGRASESVRFEQFTRRQQTDNDATRFEEKFLTQAAPSFPNVSLPVPQLLDGAKVFGNVSAANDSDGIFRHLVPGNYVAGVPVLTLPFALFHAAYPQAGLEISSFDEKGRLAVRFAGPPRTYKTYSFASIVRSFQQVLANEKPQVSLDEFRDSYVFVGMDAPGLLDLRPTPLSPSFAGVEFHATALDNLLHNSFITKLTVFQNILFSFVAIVLCAAAALFPQRMRIQVLGVSLALLIVISGIYFASLEGIWVQMIVPLAACGTAILFAVALQYQLEGHQFRFVKKAFKYYVSPEMIDQIIADPSALALGGEKKHLSIFFCDIAGFTSISESLDASKLVVFLNKFLTEMTQIILQHGGTVDKYIGDAIVAFWNAPLPVEDHASRAIAASVACQDRLEALRPALLEEFGHEIHLRIGVHTGSVSVGNFGSAERFNYTVIGDAANLASRLEGANKMFGTDILFSEATYQELRDKSRCIKVALIKVVGRSEPIAVYSVVRNESFAIKEWNNAVQLFELGKFANAQTAFEAFEPSKLTESYRNRIDKAELQTNWTPIFSLTEK